jgi:lipopolysaccharide/colanic/teichoic acid biosynthesis glycosyltransferase
MYRRFGKRFCDLLITIPALILLSPVLVLVAVLVRLRLGAPIFFRQDRPGLHGQIFRILKFRTMTEERDASGKYLPDSQRLTPLGRFLRRSSLDELPELFNVLKGEMSLVGPRPLIPRYIAYFTERERTRLDLLPGITGWAQVNGRNDLPWDDRLECDAWYVEHCSLWLDLKILAMTVLKVIRRDNVQPDPGLTFGSLDEERRARGWKPARNAAASCSTGPTSLCPKELAQ